MSRPLLNLIPSSSPTNPSFVDALTATAEAIAYEIAQQIGPKIIEQVYDSVSNVATRYGLINKLEQGTKYITNQAFGLERSRAKLKKEKRHFTPQENLEDINNDPDFVKFIEDFYEKIEFDKKDVKIIPKNSNTHQPYNISGREAVEILAYNSDLINPLYDLFTQYQALKDIHEKLNNNKNLDGVKKLLQSKDSKLEKAICDIIELSQNITSDPGFLNALSLESNLNNRLFDNAISKSKTIYTANLVSQLVALENVIEGFCRISKEIPNFTKLEEVFIQAKEIINGISSDPNNPILGQYDGLCSHNDLLSGSLDSLLQTLKPLNLNEDQLFAIKQGIVLTKEIFDPELSNRTFHEADGTLKTLSQVVEQAMQIAADSFTKSGIPMTYSDMSNLKSNRTHLVAKNGFYAQNVCVPTKLAGVYHDSENMEYYIDPKADDANYVRLVVLHEILHRFSKHLRVYNDYFNTSQHLDHDSDIKYKIVDIAIIDEIVKGIEGNNTVLTAESLLKAYSQGDLYDNITKIVKYSHPNIPESHDTSDNSFMSYHTSQDSDQHYIKYPQMDQKLLYLHGFLNKQIQEFQSQIKLQFTGLDNSVTKYDQCTTTNKIPEPITSIIEKETECEFYDGNPIDSNSSNISNSDQINIRQDNKTTMIVAICGALVGTCVTLGGVIHLRKKCHKSAIVPDHEIEPFTSVVPTSVRQKSETKNHNKSR